MATIRQIAEEAGVSPGTVSKVLNGQYKEAWPSSARRAEHIREVARRLNYRPNAAAKAIARGTFDCITVIQDDGRGRSDLPADLVYGIHDRLSQRGKHLTFARVSDALVTDPALLPKFLRETMSDGLLVNIHSRVPKRMLEIIEEQRLPAVFLNSKQPYDCVRPDDMGASLQLTRRLIERGCRRIFYVDFLYEGVGMHYSRADRLQGYLRAMNAAGLEPMPITGEAFPRLTERAATAAQCLAENGMPDAVIGYSLSLLEPFVVSGLTRAKGVALSSFGDGSHPLLFDVYAQLPQYELGCAAVDMLLQKIADPERVFPEQLMPFTITNLDEAEDTPPQPRSM